jgi:Cdc6-like AAA superfamily ATPase
MNPLTNPFSPGAGSPPPQLVGRNDTLQQAMLALARVKRGRSEKSILLVGLRGTGKTVILHEFSKLAEKEGYQTALIEAHEKKSLPELLLPELRRILFSLDDEQKNISTKVKKAFRVLKSFVSNIKINFKIRDIDFGIGIEPEKGTADSGDLEADLAQLFIAIGEAAQDQQTAIAIIIDELQYLSETELSSLIMAVHKISQKSLPLIVIGAGLPQLVAKAGRAKSYAERLFDYPELGPLKKEDAKSALQDFPAY